MDIRLEAHPHDRRQWRVYLNQYFFQYPDKPTAQRMYERVLESLGQVAPVAGAGSIPSQERRRRARECV
ncbi:hypothetical protein M8R19_07185 [Pseudomonas sp. R3.Fl]|uniref:hypothetical protein n=1 Tax=Pseudomonas TaxID=286 RepID=UPI000E2F75AA|nr:MULTISPECIES: hypothetical protein [Pseudomonas]MCL6688491.1 hypothetical protein [Pseudomonas sp. R3.Fl]MCP1607392.1 hypothetical protein [Pseudomonas citronellolis]MCP1642046.1 hypothetical protein [Pseudomonas citronellolis]MCP1658325.1 hypothetical protein [Pseudomonas citronellolis]MCP1664964.1 hypothetical protein [Pseudomonas citronellolis]